MTKLFRIIIFSFALVVTVGGTQTQVWATPFDLRGVTDPNLLAHVDFAYTPGTGTITIQITNTTTAPTETDPRLTGFAFNVPTNVTSVSSFTFSGPPNVRNWHFYFDPDDINTPGNYGKFDLAGLSGNNNNFESGNANRGIPKGNTATFRFVLGGTGLDTLTESSFLDLLSYDDPKPPEESEQYFIARFQRTGPFGSGSDFAIPYTPAAVPEPATMLLLGSGLIGIGAFVRRKFRK